MIASRPGIHESRKLGDFEENTITIVPQQEPLYNTQSVNYKDAQFATIRGNPSGKAFICHFIGVNLLIL